MGRPVQPRRICEEPAFVRFGPCGKKETSENVTMTLDEYETVRLIDLEGCDQKACAELMGVSRASIAAIYKAAREKLARCLVFGESLTLSGGAYRLCGGEAGSLCRRYCPYSYASRAERLEEIRKETNMRIAVTYEPSTGEIFQHFGRTENFKLYDVEDGKVVKSEVVGTNGMGHGALAGVLSAHKADVLICGGIGGGAQMALASTGIALVGGCSGSADKAVEDYLAGNLAYDPNPHCDHHDHGEGHECGGEGHSCCH